jgi:hypothetical protein
MALSLLLVITTFSNPRAVGAVVMLFLLAVMAHVLWYY